MKPLSAEHHLGLCCMTVDGITITHGKGQDLNVQFSNVECNADNLTTVVPEKKCSRARLPFEFTAK